MTLGSQDSRSPLTPAVCVLAALGCIALATSLTAPTPRFDPAPDSPASMAAPVATVSAEADPVAVPPSVSTALPSVSAP